MSETLSHEEIARLRTAMSGELCAGACVTDHFIQPSTIHRLLDEVERHRRCAPSILERVRAHWNGQEEILQAAHEEAWRAAFAYLWLKEDLGEMDQAPILMTYVHGSALELARMVEALERAARGVREPA